MGPVTVSRDVRLGALLSLSILLGNVLAVSSEVGFLHKAKRVKETDHLHYIEMAKGPQGRPEWAQAPPYCWRVGIPGLARALAASGMGLNAAFFLITNTVLFGFLVTLWVYLRDLGFELPFRVTGLLLLGLTQGAVRWFEWQYWMTDPACLFLVALAFLFIHRRQTLALVLVSLVAAFVRETYVIVYPYYFFRQIRSGVSFGRALVRTLAVAALPTLAVVALRVAIRPSLADDWWSGITDSMAFRFRHLGDNQPYVLTVGTFGVLFPLLLLFPARVLPLLRRHFDQALALAAVAATLVISNNTERPLAYSIPIVLPAALFNLRVFLDKTRLPGAPVLAACVGLQALFFSQQRFLEMGMSIYQPVNWWVASAMALAWAAARLALWRPRAPAAAPVQ